MRITASGYVGIGTTSPISPVTILSALTALSSAPTLTVFGNVSATGCVYSSNCISSVYTSTDTAIRPTSGTNIATGAYSIIAGGNNNTASDIYSVVTGGSCNTASSPGSIIVGGSNNTASGVYSNIAGGSYNDTLSSFSSIGGGCCNTASGLGSNVAGGYKNVASGDYSNVAGGQCNTASSVYGVVVGGCNNINAGTGSFIAGGINNTINSGVSSAFILGSNLNAICSDQTYVNNLVAGNFVYASSIDTTNNIVAGNSIFATSCVNAGSGIFYSAYTVNSVNEQNSTIGGNLTVSGAAFLYGNKYSTIIGDGALSSFTVNHNLSTSDVVMTISNVSAKQVVYPNIVITDSTKIQVSFNSVPPLTSYKVSIIGL